MSDLAPILQHVEDQEVWRRVLSALATELVQEGFDLQLLLEGGERYMLGFLNAVLGDMAEYAGPKILAGADAFFSQLGLDAGFDLKERDALLREAVSRAAGDIDGLAHESATAFNRWVQGLRRAGMSDDTILEALRADPENLAEVLGPWRRGVQDLGRNLVKIIDETVQQAIEEAMPVEEENRGSYWITMKDDAVCGRNDKTIVRSCYKRHGLLKPFAEWVKLGLPGTGLTHCRGNCRCMLVPQAYLKDGAPRDPVESAEAVRKAQERADRQHAKVVEYARKRGKEYTTGYPSKREAPEQVRRARSRTHRRTQGA